MDDPSRPETLTGYRPAGMAMWDSWFLEHQGQIHMFHLQRLAEGSQRRPEEQDWIGHAVSDDMLNWRECALAIGPGPASALDDLQPWTGCVCEHEGQFHLFYTMRSSRENSRAQRIGLAVSRDLEHWEKHPGNPVIVPDPRWYVSHEHPFPQQKVDCRDLIVVPNPAGGGWLGFHAVSQPAEEEAESSVIACARSRDLIHWEHLPPAFAPGRFAEIELPDVFQLDGRWYLTCLTTTVHGNRGGFSDPYATKGTVYAIADRPEGPYREIPGDNMLIGGQLYCGIGCRSVRFGGQRFVLYTQPGMPGGATLSPPWCVVALPDGRLRLAWHERLEAWRAGRLLDARTPRPIAGLPYSHASGGLTAGRWRLDVGGVYAGESRSGWQVADLGVGAADMEITGTVTVVQGIAGGLVIRRDSQLPCVQDDLVVLVDVAEQCIMATTLPAFEERAVRRFPVRPGTPVRLRVCMRGARLDVLVDDLLVLQTTFPGWKPIAPAVGLFVDRATVTVEALTAFRLALAGVL